MAYVSQYLTDEDKAKQQAGGGVSTTNQSDAYTSPGGSTGAPPAPAASSGSGFVNLQQYLDQNQGAGARTADAITKPLAQQADAFKTTADQTVKNAGAAFNAAGGADQSGSIQTALKADPTVAYTAASDFLGKGYTGPAAGDLSAGLSADASRLSDSLGKVDGVDATKAALQDTYGKSGGPYTSGFSELDNFLVHGDAGGRAKLGEVKAKAGDVNAAATSAAGELNVAEQRARTTLAANQQHVRDTAGLKSTDIVKGAGGRQARMSASNGFNVDAHDASLGDVLSPKEQSDLEHLATLTGGATNADWYKKTFAAGHAPPPPPPVLAPAGATPAGQTSPEAAAAIVANAAPTANGVHKTATPASSLLNHFSIPKLGGAVSQSLKNVVADLRPHGSVAAAVPNIPIKLPPAPPLKKLDVRKWH